MFLLALALVACGPRGAADAPDTSVEEEDDTDAPGPVEPACQAVARPDRDGDGHGDAWTAWTACPGDPGTELSGTDCDDADAAVHPGAVEVCNGRDDDCAPKPYEGDAADAMLWHPDADGDGFGDATSPILACSPPRDAVADGSDCDDASALASPAGVEVCDGRGGDEDCDGLRDAEDPSSSGDRVWYVDGDGDGWGGAAEATCAPTAAHVDASGDCDDSDASAWPGATERCGVDADCDGRVTPCALRLSWSLGSAETLDAGPLVVADLDGDGYDDLLTGNAWSREDGGQARGALWIVPGPVTGPGRVDQLATGHVVGGADEELLGISRSAGDLDGDGRADLVIGSAGVAFAGAVLIFAGGPTGELTSDDATATLWGDAVRDESMRAVAAGDLDGDGHGDVLVGGNPFVAGYRGRGAVYVARGPFPGDRDLTGADALLYGELGAFAQTPAAGDVDGDGWGDVVVGAAGDATAGEWAGAVYVVYGPYAGSLALSDVADVALFGTEPYEASGAVLAVGDLDGDGGDDLLVGSAAIDVPGSSPARVYACAGPLATGSLAACDGLVTSDVPDDELGASVAILDDGSGGVHLVLGAPNASEGSLPRGALFVVPAPVMGAVDLSDGAARVEGGTDRLGASVTTGDLTGDGVPDALAVEGVSGGYRGAVHLLEGTLF